MKKVLIGLIACLFFTGCDIKRDYMEEIDIYTSVYPTEYITSRLYGEHSTITSIYPDGVIPEKYSLNDKQIKDYSQADLFIFDGLSNEKDYLKSMLKFNKNLKIIDSTLSMEFSNNQEELWLDPSNALMIARNVKTGLDEYITNHYLKNDIEKNYETLKLDLSTLGAKMNVVSSSSADPTIVISNDMFLFLKKYGFNVISLDPDSVTDKDIADVKKRISDGLTKNIFVVKGEEISSDIQAIINETSVSKLELHSLSTLSDSDRNNKKDYISISFENINLLKQELYK